MREADVKTNAQLVDESITAAFRVAELGGRSDMVKNVERAEALAAVLNARLGNGIGTVILDLAIVLRATWVAQEIVMSDVYDEEVAVAARQAQRLNAHRTRLVQRIDQLLGEDSIAVATKTYDRSNG